MDCRRGRKNDEQPHGDPTDASNQNVNRLLFLRTAMKIFYETCILQKNHIDETMKKKKFLVLFFEHLILSRNTTFFMI